jgi:hypothetical protein
MAFDPRLPKSNTATHPISDRKINARGHAIMLGKRGSVMLFLRKIPEGVTRKELKAFIRSAVKELDNRPISLTKAVCNCTVLCISDLENGSREYHGLVEVQPAKAAMCAIKALDGKKLKGRPVEVHRYRQRSRLLTQRDGSIGNALGAGAGIERRRRNLKIDLVSA